MKKAFEYFFFSVIIFLCAACHKYPDGGWTTNAVRHLAGTTLDGGKIWHVSKYVVNGIDSTDFITGKSSFGYTVGPVNFMRDFFEKTKQTCSTPIYSYNTELIDKRRSLSFEKSDFINCGTIICEYEIFNPLKINSGTIVWNIRELNKGELKLILFDQSIFELTLTSP